MAKFYSLGFWVDKRPNNNTVIGHNGALTYGTYSLIALIPEKNISVAAVFNHFNSDKLQDMNADLKNITMAYEYK